MLKQKGNINFRKFLLDFVYVSFLLALGLFTLFFYKQNYDRSFLTFSDGAKFADVARNLVSGSGYGASFSFFGDNVFRVSRNQLFPAGGIPQLMPRMIAITFSLLGTSDFSVILTSIFHFVLLVLATYLLGTKLFGKLAGFLAGLAVASNINFLDYATSGASEPLFSFLAVIGAYLVLLKKRWANAIAIIVLALLYFARPQAFIFIAGLVFLFLIVNVGFKKAVITSFLLAVGAYLFDKLVLYPLSFRYPVYPIFIRGKQALFSYSSSVATSDALRGAVAEKLSAFQIASKVFYNLYNFYKLLPQIASPYMWALFVIGLFKWGKDKIENSLKIATIFMVVATFLVTALTIPFFRYLHPVIPLVYLFATATLVWIVEKMVKKRLVAIVSTLLIVFFVVGQTLGVIFLDSRFKAARTNRGKPPVYVKLSHILRDNTETKDIVITNLDTWGSWYGERKTVWFPLKPDQLKLGEEDKIVFDAVFLTSYLIDDENYYMGDEWRQIFYNSENPENEYIRNNYTLEGVYEVPAEETYEKQAARAVLLTRKKVNGF